MRGHTKSAHGMNITEYREKYNQVYYDLVELVLHKCGICEEYLLFDSDYIATHLKVGAKTNPHNISHANYNEKYMKLQKISENPFGKKIKKESSINFVTVTAKKEMVKNHTSNNSESEVGHKVTNLDADFNALEKDIDNVLESLDDVDNINHTEAVTVESFRKLLDSLSIDGEEIRFPALEALLTLDI